LFFLFSIALTTIEAACPLGQTEFANHCYVLSHTKLAWFEAERICEGAGSFLTSIENGFERSALQSMLHDASTLIDEVWTGGTNVNDLVHYEWIDGMNFTFQQWKPGFPTNDQSANCVAMDGLTGLFANQICTQTKYYICKLPRIAPITTPAPNCPLNYELHDGFCYKAIVERYFNFDQAEKVCVSEGGHVASIHSLIENDYIVALVNRQTRLNNNDNNPANRRREWEHIWIGLINPQHNNVFRWTDGSTALYFNWKKGEPWVNGAEYCTLIFPSNSGAGFPEMGHWEVVECEMGLAGFVCKQPSVSQSSSS